MSSTLCTGQNYSQYCQEKLHGKSSTVTWERERRSDDSVVKAFVTLPEDLSSVASTHIRRHTTTWNSTSRIQWPLLASSGTHTWHTYIYIYKHSKIFKRFFKERESDGSAEQRLRRLWKGSMESHEDSHTVGVRCGHQGESYSQQSKELCLYPTAPTACHPALSVKQIRKLGYKSGPWAGVRLILTRRSL